MWIISRTGLVSLVEHADNPDNLRARARRKEHLVDTFDLNDSDVIDLGENCPDYRWHADIPRQNAAAALVDALMDIDYSSHVKESVSGPDNEMYRAMMSAWAAFNRLQARPGLDADWWTSADGYDDEDALYGDVDEDEFDPAEEDLLEARRRIGIGRRTAGLTDLSESIADKMRKVYEPSDADVFGGPKGCRS